jgi:protein involved in polysaccharide export with SLBB domain
MNKLIRVPLAVFFVATAPMTIAKAAGRRVAASDVIQIRVLNQPDLDTQVRVAPDGTISVPYVGRFRADVIAARIRKALTRAGILKWGRSIDSAVGQKAKDSLTRCFPILPS